jgi:transcriptional regulator with XRE-family HTH domain
MKFSALGRLQIRLRSPTTQHKKSKSKPKIAPHAGFIGRFPHGLRDKLVVAVTPDEIKQLRKELSCTARELATALGIDQKEVLAWEAGELFPTKRYVTQMELLRTKGPSGIVRAPKGKSAKTGMQRMADPKLWELVRKLVEHPALFDEVSKAAEKYADPGAEAPSATVKKD